MRRIRRFTNSVWTYLKEARREMQRVNWPERRDVVRMTAVVVAFSAAVALVLGGFDYLFSQAALRVLPGSAPAGVSVEPDGAANAQDVPSVSTEQNIPLEVVGPDGQPIPASEAGPALPDTGSTE